MWENIVELDRPQVTVWHMCIACWIPKTTNTHSEFVVFIAFPLQQWLKKCALKLHYMYVACLVKIYVFMVLHICSMMLCVMMPCRLLGG